MIDDLRKKPVVAYFKRLFALAVICVAAKILKS